MPRPIFVAGSNLAGRHGKGAALEARLRWGAVYGVGRGRSGHAYLLPTKDYTLRPLPLEKIKENVLEFKAYVEQNPELTFLVTRVGCGLAGYKDEQIAPMFREFPNNCSFDPRWMRYLK